MIYRFFEWLLDLIARAFQELPAPRPLQLTAADERCLAWFFGGAFALGVFVFVLALIAEVRRP